MSFRAGLPQERGSYDGALSTFLGQRFMVSSVDLSSTSNIIAGNRTGNEVILMVVLNSSGITLLPKRSVRFKAGTNFTEVDGYSTTTGYHPVAVVDEFLLGLPGVATGSYFYVAIGGPTLCLTDLAGADNNVITENDPLIAMTAATSQSTTAGRVYSLPSAAASTHLGTNLLGVLGYALSAKTTANTNADLLVHLLHKL